MTDRQTGSQTDLSVWRDRKADRVNTRAFFLSRIIFLLVSSSSLSQPLSNCQECVYVILYVISELKVWYHNCKEYDRYDIMCVCVRRARAPLGVKEVGACMRTWSENYMEVRVRVLLSMVCRIYMLVSGCRCEKKEIGCNLARIFILIWIPSEMKVSMVERADAGHR